MEVVKDTNGSAQLRPLAMYYEHPAMKAIRQVVHQYQVRSPAHFELDLEVCQTAVGVQYRNKYTSKAAVHISLEGCTVEGRISLPLICRVTSCGRRPQSATWKCSSIEQGQGHQKLEHFLCAHFPIINGPLQRDTLWRWWLSNGKTFNWSDLPTELKERVIEHCMHQPHVYGLYKEKLTNFDRRYKNDHKIRLPGPYEIVDQLSDWYPLLYVSHQVRAITLRLCIAGGGSIHSKGLCISSFSYRSLREQLDRLGRYYQMIEPNSVPTVPNEEALAKCYDRFPRINPHLKQYATLRHGIQKIGISMDFLSFMRFFNVEIGSFQRFQMPRWCRMDYRVLGSLPNLNEIVIRLPPRPCGGWRDSPLAGGPQLFHHDSPCPRRLHRIIYERVAKVLAPHRKVQVLGFIDDEEQQRFLSRRSDAVNALRFTEIDFEELYADDGGGVKLPAEVERVAEASESALGAAADHEYPENLQDDFFPPSCHCDEPCILAPILGVSEDRW